MRILYLSYWSIRDGLTDSTVIPNAHLIASFEQVEQIVLVTIERDGAIHAPVDLRIPKLSHVPLVSKGKSNLYFNKFSDFTVFPNLLSDLISDYKFDCILSRTASAGALAYLVHKRTKVPFIVESFEPHAEYMRESHEWSYWGLRYQFQRFWEKKQIQFAKGLITVSENYKNYLIQKGIPASKVKMIPCTVDIDLFRMNFDSRNKLRNQLKFSENDIVGIYLGKFGGIYYDGRAFEIFKEAFNFFGNHFRLLILSPDDPFEIKSKLKMAGINQDRCITRFVPHQDIPSYLSASDFAFSTIKPAISRKFCSPVKDGEYWASGLPILLTDGVGDDFEIIKRENAGALFSEKSDLKKAFDKINRIINEPDYRDRISDLAAKYRSPKIALKVYREIFQSLQQYLSVSPSVNPNIDQE